MDVTGHLSNNILLFDGAMGSVLQARGLKPGETPELLNITAPEIVTQIHREYLLAGADIVTANTFQANELRLGKEAAYEAVKTGVICARSSGAPFVALDVGPLGQLLEPLGTVSFETAYEIFRAQMTAGEKSGADLILIETMSDLYEAKAAILAAKENTRLPVFCTMTFQEDGRTFLGCDPLTAAVTLQGLGVDALGANCSMGPLQLWPVIETILKYSRVPVILQANAGLPVCRDSGTLYQMPPEQYAAHVLEMVRKGVRIAGGCCGTTPEHIRVIKEGLKNISPAIAEPIRISACTSGGKTVILDGAVTEIGERINPTGKKDLCDSLRGGNPVCLINEAIAQTQAGAQILDVNVSLPEPGEPERMANAVRAIQAVTASPLQIDSSDHTAIEAGLRAYNGKPIINAVNGGRGCMEKIFPLAKKYGALVIGLTLDENGIPADARGRVEIARRIRDSAISFGIPQEDLLIDCLVLTAAAQQDQAGETLAAVRLVKKELGLKTLLGISNISFGLPQREAVNAAFLASALSAGLDAAIIDPLSGPVRETLDAYRVLNGEDKNAVHFISKYTQKTKTEKTSGDIGTFSSLSDIIEQGRINDAAEAVRKLLETSAPTDIIDNELIPALDRVGKRFEAGEIFLPQLMQSAQAVQSGFGLIREHMNSIGKKPVAKGRILIATVHGDIHDIGKNIAGMLLESYGYEVIDLGKDVPAGVIVDTIRRENIRLAGLSALMTTTVKSIKETISAARSAGLCCSFFAGGAVLDGEYAAFAGADYYAKDAMESVAIANRFFGNTP